MGPWRLSTASSRRHTHKQQLHAQQVHFLLQHVPVDVRPRLCAGRARRAAVRSRIVLIHHHGRLDDLPVPGDRLVPLDRRLQDLQRAVGRMQRTVDRLRPGLADTQVAQPGARRKAVSHDRIGRQVGRRVVREVAGPHGEDQLFPFGRAVHENGVLQLAEADRRPETQQSPVGHLDAAVGVVGHLLHRVPRVQQLRQPGGDLLAAESGPGARGCAARRRGPDARSNRSRPNPAAVR